MTLRIASVPAGHPYVRRLAVPGVRVLPDPPVPGAPPGQWWPSPLLTPSWVTQHRDEIDLLHVHFGTESLTTDEIEAWLAAVARTELPLVFTAHDIDHPHLADQAPYRAQLNRILPAADAVITLTSGAATTLQERHGVRAHVIPHPQLADDAWFARADAIRRSVDDQAVLTSTDPIEMPRGRSGRPSVSLHLRSGRANIETGAWLDRVASAMRKAGADLRVYVNDEPSPAAQALADRARRLADPAWCTVVVRPRPDDDGLAHELATSDLALLPYAHGTHSGWVELCWDLGVHVLAPPVGHVAEQHLDAWFLRTVDPTHGPMLRDALAALHHEPVPTAATRRDLRRAQAAQIAAAHAEIYASAVDRHNRNRPIEATTTARGDDPHPTGDAPPVAEIPA